jgi:hypothetical protein
MKSKNMKYKFACFLIAAGLTGCASMDQSLELGSGLGFAVGTAATLGGYSAGGHSPSIETVAVGAGIGAAIGLITSYFTHQSVAEDRKSCEADQIEMHFGDLPPSPFIVPKPQTKKGSR